mmetsp:Transcript_63043/g.112022  ORF Transcript_63043/g.112022 Transcript_63043/m.112022 type:complete len:83 (-) Transcript_63043:39-287(-)
MIKNLVRSLIVFILLLMEVSLHGCSGSSCEFQSSGSMCKASVSDDCCAIVQASYPTIDCPLQDDKDALLNRECCRTGVTCRL